MSIMDFDVQEFIAEMNEEIASRPISEPCEPEEFIDQCDWSRTGFAIWKRETMKHGTVFAWCTCLPALPPQERT